MVKQWITQDECSFKKQIHSHCSKDNTHLVVFGEVKHIANGNKRFSDFPNGKANNKKPARALDKIKNSPIGEGVGWPPGGGVAPCQQWLLLFGQLTFRQISSQFRHGEESKFFQQKQQQEEQQEKQGEKKHKASEAKSSDDGASSSAKTHCNLSAEGCQGHWKECTKDECKNFELCHPGPTILLCNPPRCTVAELLTTFLFVRWLFDIGFVVEIECPDGRTIPVFCQVPDNHGRKIFPRLGQQFQIGSICQDADTALTDCRPTTWSDR